MHPSHKHQMPLRSPVGEQSGKCTTLVLALAIFALGVAATPANAQNGEKKDSVAADAVDAVTQPLSDLNLRSKDIPIVLTRAQSGPYDLTGLSECSEVRSEIAHLDEVLGPDADAPPEDGGVLNKGLKIGGNVLGGFIPFRALVRQLSGANAQRARWEAAIFAGVARRSFLKGVAFAKQCKTSDEIALKSAENVLKMGAPAE